MTKGPYNTKQRQAVRAFLDAHADRYLSVDDVFGTMRQEGSGIGRTTAYRTLESLVKEGTVAKVVAPGGGESRYRMIDPAHPDEGQLVCLDCGRVLPLDCDMLVSFGSHVLREHGFAISFSRTVLYGHCADCMDTAERQAAESALNEAAAHHKGACTCGQRGEEVSC